MHFIGIYSDDSKYIVIKQYLNDLEKKGKIKIIQITPKNIENLRNILFETIVICYKNSIDDDKRIILNNLCNNCAYILINSDLCYDMDIKCNKKVNCISYGVNHKSTITISSIQEDKAIISIQRNICNLKGKDIEMGEKEIDIRQYKNSRIDNILTVFTISLIYKK